MWFGYETRYDLLNFLENCVSEVLSPQKKFVVEPGDFIVIGLNTSVYYNLHRGGALMPRWSAPGCSDIRIRPVRSISPSTATVSHFRQVNAVAVPYTNPIIRQVFVKDTPVKWAWSYVRSSGNSLK